MEKIQALKPKKSKPYALVAGKIYLVSEGNAKAIIKAGTAIKAKDDAEVGKVYALPKSAAAKDFE